MNRRQLLQAIAGTAIFVELPIAAKPRKEGLELQGAPLADALVKSVARVMAENFAKQQLPRISAATDLFGASRDSFTREETVRTYLAPGRLRVNDSMLDGRTIVKFDKHMEASFAIPDITAVVKNSRLLETYCMPSVIALAESMRKHAGSNVLLAATPPPLTYGDIPNCTGLIEKIVRVEQRIHFKNGSRRRQIFPMCVAMTFDCDKLRQLFIARVFYGVSKTVSAERKVG